MDAFELGRASLDSLSRMLGDAGNEIAALERLVAELRKRDGDRAVKIWTNAAARLTAARKAAGGQTSDLLNRFLSSRGLVRAAEKPLHRYRMTPDEFAAFREYLIAAHKLKRLDLAGQRDGAVFVLFSAEWFRRSFAGGVVRWQSLTDVIGDLSYNTRVELTRAGLMWWRRRVRVVGGAKEWLFTLRLEGGFPSRLLQADDRGWLSSHLRRLVSAAAPLDLDVLEDSLIEKAAGDPYVPQTFRTVDFHALCAEFAAGIVRLRRLHGKQAASRGTRLSVYLDEVEPGWREVLAVEGAGAARLLDNLVSENLQALGGLEARCRRLLINVSGDWREALRLGLDGEATLPSSIRNGASRLHALPAGQLADMVSGAVCVLEPPDDVGPWVARHRAGAPREPILDFAFASRVIMDIQSEGRVVTTLLWPGGEAVRADVITFAEEEAETGAGKGNLVMLATGSCRNKRQVLFIVAPIGFKAVNSAAVDVAPTWVSKDRQLFRVEETVLVGSDSHQVFYRIEPGADRDETDRLIVEGSEMRGATTIDGDVIFAGVPTIQARSNSMLAKQNDEIYWRKIGDREWSSVRAKPVLPGAVEVVWRDPGSGVARDRRRLAALPASSNLRRQPLLDGSARFTLEGAPGWTAQAVVGGGAQLVDLQVMVDGVSWRIVWQGPERRVVTLRLIGPAEARLDVITPFPFGAGRFLRPDGLSFPNNTFLTLDALKGARAVADGATQLWIETRGGGSRATHRVFFEDELPLWSLRDIALALLAEADDLDGEVSFSLHPGESRLRLRRYGVDLRVVRESGGFRLPPLHEVFASRSHLLRWRSLIDMTPSGSRDLGHVEAGVLSAGGIIELPEDLLGPGVVYLAAEEGPLSRPFLINRPYSGLEDLSPLKQAVLIANRRHREDAFDIALSDLDAGSGQSDDDLAWLHGHLAVSDALGPLTFEVLSRLARSPHALAAFVAAAPDELSLDRAWSLEKELSFLWVLVPVAMWSGAFAARRERTRTQLVEAGLVDQAPRFAEEKMRQVAEHFMAYDDALHVAFWLGRLGVKPPAGARQGQLIAQDYIRRLVSGAEAGASGSCFHTDPIAPFLRSLCPWLGGFDDSHHEALEAPVVAALCAGGRLATLDRRQRLRIRHAMIQDRQHFNEAYASALTAIAAGRC